MKVLGISEPHCDASCALVENGRLLAAAGEERFTRDKRHKGFPFQALDWMLEKTGTSLHQIDKIAISKYETLTDVGLYSEALKRHYREDKPKSDLLVLILDRLIWQLCNVTYCYQASFRLNQEINQWIKSHSIDPSLVTRVDHHSAHAASAWYCSGFDKALIVTMDGQGAGVTATISRASSGQLKRIHTVYLPNSVGQFYTLITLASGFKMNRHEGKITGLAACGSFDQEIQSFVNSLIECKDGSIFSHAIYGHYFKLKSLLSRSRLEDVCYAFQQRLEQVVTCYIRHYLDANNDIENLALGGGVFANVRLNQKIAQLSRVRNLFVYPNMGDGGSCVGAAFLVDPPTSTKATMRSLYLGPAFTRSQTEDALNRMGIKYFTPSNVPEWAAELLASGKVVARFSGAMEFGPRALGNRSILASAKYAENSDKLNEKLHRSDFMPFAPVTMEKLASRCYLFDNNVKVPMSMMTVSVGCTDWMKTQCPAAVHVDGTARPQIVSSGNEYHDILEAYYKLTGEPALINTSFNLHEEPIVCSPEDAIKTFLNSGIDALILEGFAICR